MENFWDTCFGYQNISKYIIRYFKVKIQFKQEVHFGFKYTSYPKCKSNLIQHFKVLFTELCVH
jgi:hypothetical protein